MDFQLEKNAPLPDKRKGWGKWQKLIDEMDVGAAITFQDDENLTAYHGINRAAKNLGFKIVMRTLDDGKIKVWKQEAIEAAE